MMRRRAFLAAVLLAGLLALPATGASAAGKQQKRPNVVMVVTDDQTLSSYSKETMPRTHRLLGRKGTTFSEAIVTTPLCCPSRATMITGQYGHNNGVLRNRYASLRSKGNVLPAWLKNAGYRTMHVGKFMNQYARAVGDETKPAPGWDEWRTIVRPHYFNYELMINGGRRSFGSAAKDYLTRVVSKQAKRLIGRHAPRRKPFFLQVDHYPPHDDFATQDPRCTGGAIPDPRDRGLFTGDTLPRTPNFDEADVSDKPSFIQKLEPLDAATESELVRLHGCALASLQAADRSVAELWRAVKRAGDLRDTVFVFVSDNGFHYGEHRIPTSKQNPYEETLRVPLVISAPRDELGGKRSPRRVGAHVGNVDLPATILDFAGAEPCRRGDRGCRTMDGRSLVPLLRGRNPGWSRNRPLVVELDRGKSPVERDGRACDYTGVRTPKGILVEHRGAIDPSQDGECVPLLEYELYDLRRDPYQLDNLHSSVTGTAASGLEAKLARQLAKLRDCEGIKGRDKRPRSASWCK